MLEELYKGLFDDGNISIPFEQFQNKFENDSNGKVELFSIGSEVAESSK